MRTPSQPDAAQRIELPDLPVRAVLPEVAQALAAPPHRAVLVAPPGAGKTTLVPLHLLSSLPPGRILLAEPRRVATRAAASRMAQLLGEAPGQTVGWRMRLDTRVSPATRIEVVTEGVLTRMLLADPELPGVAAILFDEFHERSLDADLGLALALEAAGALRPDLALLVMSATLDGARVAALLGEAPVIRSEGRAFPVAIRHRTPEPGARIEDEVARTILDELAAGSGSILAFLPGAFEIERAAERLRTRLPGDAMLCPLYAALPPAAQDEAIRPAPAGRRKVVLATTIAETSITIDGVTTVVDSGLKRQPRFEPATGLQRLETVRVSLAAADQRAGRAGRTAPGTAIRLWRAEQTGALEPFDRPEILSADLAGLTLDAVSWGVRSPRDLPFLDAPPAPALAEADALLHELGALDADGRLTATGEAMRLLPLAPRLARMVAGAARGAVRDLAARLAVLLSEPGLGGPSPDLSERLRRWRAEENGRARDASALARRIARSVPDGIAGPFVVEDDPGALLALAYPDRIAFARGGPGRFVLSNGRGARIDERDALAREVALVVADLGESESAQARVGTIRAAAPLDRDALDALLRERAVDEDAVVFDPATRSVRGRRRRRVGRAVLSEQPIALPGGEAAGLALMAGARELGLRALPFDNETERLLRRMRFAALHEPDWPALDEPALLDGLETWLLPFVPGATALGAITPGQLRQGLQSLVPPGARLEAAAPSHFTAPTGNAHPIRYEADGPVLAIRVQELFGLKTHPSLANGRLPLTLELLSPASRPIQITRDLPAFWAGSWRDVRADLRGRYPRHPWPEDPAAAAPTARAKPRG